MISSEFKPNFAQDHRGFGYYGDVISDSDRKTFRKKMKESQKILSENAFFFKQENTNLCIYMPVDGHYSPVQVSYPAVAIHIGKDRPSCFAIDLPSFVLKRRQDKFILRYISAVSRFCHFCNKL